MIEPIIPICIYCDMPVKQKPCGCAVQRCPRCMDILTNQKKCSCRLSGPVRAIPEYGALVEILKHPKFPITWFPGILLELVKAAYARGNVFTLPDGASKIIQRQEDALLNEAARQAYEKRRKK